MSTVEIETTMPEVARPSGPPLNDGAMPAATLGMWLFLASEAMFFLAMLGSFVVLESAGGQHQLFANSAAMLSRNLGIGSAISLILSSLAITIKWPPLKWIALLAAVVFILMQGTQWFKLLTHRTIISHESGQLQVTDGSDNLTGPGSGMLNDAIRAPVTAGFDIHKMTPEDLKLDGARRCEGNYSSDHIQQTLNYGPSRNNFFASYFLFTGAHAVHLIAGVIAIIFCTLPRKRISDLDRKIGLVAPPPPGSSVYLRDLRAGHTLPTAVQIYWHFVNAIGVLSLATLYFV